MAFPKGMYPTDETSVSAYLQQAMVRYYLKKAKKDRVHVQGLNEHLVWVSDGFSATLVSWQMLQDEAQARAGFPIPKTPAGEACGYGPTAYKGADIIKVVEIATRGTLQAVRPTGWYVRLDKGFAHAYVLEDDPAARRPVFVHCEVAVVDEEVAEMHRAERAWYKTQGHGAPVLVYLYGTEPEHLFAVWMPLAMEREFPGARERERSANTRRKNGAHDEVATTS